jgi:hypothetical protein
MSLVSELTFGSNTWSLLIGSKIFYDDLAFFQQSLVGVGYTPHFSTSFYPNPINSTGTP